MLDGLPDDEQATIAVWLAALEPRLRPAAAAVQRRLPRLSWLRPLPGHFLHVTLAGSAFVDRGTPVTDLVRRGRAALRGVQPFTLAYPRLNCFHDAVVAEVEGVAVHEIAARLRADGGPYLPYLPHLSLAYTTAAGPPDELRDALRRLRETHLGTQEVREVLFCLVPASRTTIMQPWTVAGRVELGQAES